jgi:hypothetical protein
MASLIEGLMNWTTQVCAGQGRLRERADSVGMVATAAGIMNSSSAASAPFVLCC